MDRSSSASSLCNPFGVQINFPYYIRSEVRQMKSSSSSDHGPTPQCRPGQVTKKNGAFIIYMETSRPGRGTRSQHKIKKNGLWKQNDIRESRKDVLSHREIHAVWVRKREDSQRCEDCFFQEDSSHRDGNRQQRWYIGTCHMSEELLQ